MPDALSPVVNVLTVLGVLSIAAERLGTLVKTRIRSERQTEERRSQIDRLSIFCGIVVALIVKADLLELLRHADDPWSTLGWTVTHGDHVVRVMALGSPAMVAAIVGCCITGVGLGFGSAFWHDSLRIVEGIRQRKGSELKPAGAVTPLGGGSAAQPATPPAPSATP